MIPASPPATRGVSIYVDGFNVYHRLLEHDTAIKWLCFKTLFSKFLLPNNPIKRIKFFTAKVDPYADKPTPRQIRQKAYWDALQANGVEIILGRLEIRKRECKSVCRGTYFTPSEKMSDVKLALHVLRDFDANLRDITCVMSADLDIVPALHMIREEDAKCAIRIVIPTIDKDLYWSRSKDFGFARMMFLEREWLLKSQLPNPCPLLDGGHVSRPDTW